MEILPFWEKSGIPLSPKYFLQITGVVKVEVTRLDGKAIKLFCFQEIGKATLGSGL